MASFSLNSDNTDNINNSNNIKLGEENNNIPSLILNQFDKIKLNIESDFKNNNNKNKNLINYNNKNNNKNSIINNINKNKNHYSYHQICYEPKFNKNKLIKICNKNETILNNQLYYCDNVHFHKKCYFDKNDNGLCIWSWEFGKNVVITRCLTQFSFSLDSTEKGIDLYIGNEFFKGNKDKNVTEYVKRNFYKLPIDKILGSIFNLEMDLSEYTIGFGKLCIVCIMNGGNFNEFGSNQDNNTFNCTFKLCENFQINNSNNSDNSNSDNDNNNQNNSSNKESFCFIKKDISVKSIENSNTSSSNWVLTNKQSLVINNNNNCNSNSNSNSNIFCLFDSSPVQSLPPQHFQQINFDNSLSINVNNNNNKLSINGEKSISINRTEWELVEEGYLNYESLEYVLKLVYFTSYESLSYENFKSISPERITYTIYICQHLSFCKLLKLFERFIFENVD
ncbi:hypothetical protein DDB_G0270598 [Dictyostelium discoideum AX4]|uniref:Uncharacterized protein n=1 Tax=Dictyostelium discoideum TaxID=44689 RepID=Q55DH3_DICDI|nr:hypothetical protein DDB_G0270598 [Dictyostelium discoideum AX4]EAL72649.1 hypothetical protein DDB_G0270598 [Dictyostelium discoideum AX4]|eukprot:XP_646158.1 hypothetical protein DDB_G0270598 [Dictyostelium discoideum AX4]